MSRQHHAVKLLMRRTLEQLNTNCKHQSSKGRINVIIAELVFGLFVFADFPIKCLVEGFHTMMFSPQIGKTLIFTKFVLHQ